MRLKNSESEQRQPTPVDSKGQVACHAEYIHDHRTSAIVLQELCGANAEVVADRGAVLPRRDCGPEAVIGEARGRIEEGVLRGLKVAEEVCRGGCLGDFVGVVERGETAEARFDFAVGGAVGDTQVLVVVGGEADGVVCFVDCVEEVGCYDGDVNSLAVLDVEGGSGLGFGITRADGDAVPY